MNKWARRFFYLVASYDFALSEYFRWVMEDYAQSAYWLAKALFIFLVGYIVFAKLQDKPTTRAAK